MRKKLYMQRLFEDVKEEFAKDNIFNEHEKITLRETSFEQIVKELEIYNLTNTSADVKGIAFEKFLGKTLRGELGQFFTPRTIVNFMVEVLDPQEGELICDFRFNPQKFFGGDGEDRTAEPKKKSKEEASLRKKDEDGKTGHRGYKGVFCFRFAVDFKRKSYIAKNKEGKNYTEAVLLVEKKNPFSSAASASLDYRKKKGMEHLKEINLKKLENP